jgi:hypothetical protein
MKKKVAAAAATPVSAGSGPGAGGAGAGAGAGAGVGAGAAAGRVHDAGPVPSGVTTTGEVLYEDAAALENGGMDDAEMASVLVQDAGSVVATSGGATTGLSYERARQVREATAALLKASAQDAELGATPKEDEDAGEATPLFDF